MTSINPKLTAAITTIAMLAPVAGSQAAGFHAMHSARHWISGSTSHVGKHQVRRAPVKSQRHSRGI